MVISFLDLLGFTELVKDCPCFAGINFNRFNEIWREMHSDSNYVKDDSCEFAQAKFFFAPNNIISISDSMIITADIEKTEKFIVQLCEFVKRCFINNERNPFCTIERCGYMFDDSIECSYKKNKGVCAFPFEVPIGSMSPIGQDVEEIKLFHKKFRMMNSILFRGCLRVGNQIMISNSSNVFNGDVVNSLNVFGYDYVKTVSLEKKGKGARLFCDKTIVSATNSDFVRKGIRSIDRGNEIYEILWSYISLEYAETKGWNATKSFERVAAAVGVSEFNGDNKLFPLDYAIELVKIHQTSEDYISVQYIETLKSVALGVYKYAIDNDVTGLSLTRCGKVEKIEDIINGKISPYTEYRVSEKELDDFL
jgi:hypothetical protein